MVKITMNDKRGDADNKIQSALHFVGDHQEYVTKGRKKIDHNRLQDNMFHKDE